ncbi:MAG: hypothetical protein WA350_05135 [Candidatus Sulfotelmatobacter sp.]
MATIAIVRRAAARRPIAPEQRVIRRKAQALHVHAKYASLETVRNNNAEQCSALPEVAKAHAHDLSNDALAKHLVNSGLGPTLRKLSELLPYLDELTKRFTHLCKGQTIMGYTSMNVFCLGELHRTSRAVRYALSGRNTSKKKGEENEPTSFWAALAHSLNELVPSSSDGVEHKVVNRIETAILKMREGEKIEPKWTLDQIVFSCQEISTIFGVYAKMLDPKRAEEFLANPNIAKAEERLREKLSRRPV